MLPPCFVEAIEDLFQHDRSLGVFSVEAEIGQVRGDRMLAELIDDATAHRVTFYSHDPAGLRAVGSSAENSSPEANLEIAQETEYKRLLRQTDEPRLIGPTPSTIGAPSTFATT